MMKRIKINISALTRTVTILSSVQKKDSLTVYKLSLNTSAQKNICQFFLMGHRAYFKRNSTRQAARFEF